MALNKDCDSREESIFIIFGRLFEWFVIHYYNNISTTLSDTFIVHKMIIVINTTKSVDYI